MWARILYHSGSSVLTACLTAVVFLTPASARLAPSLVAVGVYLALAALWHRLLHKRVWVSVTQTGSIAAPPERVWELLSSAEARSLLPGCHMFEFPTPDGMPPLRAGVAVSPSGQVTSSVYEFAELPADSGPGRALMVRNFRAPEAQVGTMTIRIVRNEPGTRVSITVRHPVNVAGQFDVKAALRAQMTDWLGECAAVLTGQRAWPSQEIQPDVLAALAAPPPGEKTLEASATALITADPGRVWEVVWDPATSLVLPESSTVAAGFVPGTPTGRIGEIQYFVSPGRQGAMQLDLAYVARFEPGRMALIQGSYRGVACEMLFLIEPEPDGARLTLTFRVFLRARVLGRVNPMRRVRAAETREKLQANLEKEVVKYKVLLEGTDAPTRA